MLAYVETNVEVDGEEGVFVVENGELELEQVEAATEWMDDVTWQVPGTSIGSGPMGHKSAQGGIDKWE